MIRTMKMNKLVSIVDVLFSSLFIIGLFDLVLAILSIMGLDIQTRGTQWYKMTDYELYDAIKYSLGFILLSLIYFKFVYPILSKYKGCNK